MRRYLGLFLFFCFGALVGGLLVASAAYVVWAYGG